MGLEEILYCRFCAEGDVFAPSDPPFYSRRSVFYCCENCRGVGQDEFQKIVVLEDYGLSLYRHHVCSRSTRQKISDSDEDMYILHNTKNNEISAVDFIPAFVGNQISCLRCRQVALRALKFIQDMKTIGRKGIRGICDHCVAKQLQQSYLKCEKIVKKIAEDKNIDSAYLVPYDSFGSRKIEVLNKFIKSKHINAKPEKKPISFPTQSIEKPGKEIQSSRLKIAPEQKFLAERIFPTHEQKREENSYIDLEAGTRELKKPALELFTKMGSSSELRPGEYGFEYKFFKKPEIVRKDPSIMSSSELISKTRQDLKSRREKVGDVDLKYAKTKQKHSVSIRKNKDQTDKDVTQEDKDLTRDSKDVTKGKGTSKASPFKTPQVQKSTDTTEKLKVLKQKKPISFSSEIKGKSGISERDTQEKEFKRIEELKRQDDKIEARRQYEEKIQQQKLKKKQKDKEKQKVDGDTGQIKEKKSEAIKKKSSMSEKDKQDEEFKTMEELKNQEDENEARRQYEEKNQQQNIKKKQKNKDKQKVDGDTGHIKAKKSEELRQKEEKDLLNKVITKQDKRKIKSSEEKKERETVKLPKIKSEAKIGAEKKDLFIPLKSVKVQKSEGDNLIYGLIKIKQKSVHSVSPPKEKDTPSKAIKSIAKEIVSSNKRKRQKYSTTMLESDSRLDIESLVDVRSDEGKTIIGNKILNPAAVTKYFIKKQLGSKNYRPIVQTNFEAFTPQPSKANVLAVDVQSQIETLTEKSKKLLSKTQSDLKSTGAILYLLSDNFFIDNGWTQLPEHKILRKVNVYRMRLAYPQFDWFENNKPNGYMYYDTGEVLAQITDEGRGRWYYRNGNVALDYYDAEDVSAKQRIVIYSKEGPEKSAPRRHKTVLAVFDYSGNGIVFDHTGKIRLKYNQTEGVVLDRKIGPESHWKWHDLNEPPDLEHVLLDIKEKHKDPRIEKFSRSETQKSCSKNDNANMLAIEFENTVKKRLHDFKKYREFKPFPITLKAFKINDNFSLKVLDQTKIFIIFRDGLTKLKLNIGMMLDPTEIVDTDIIEIAAGHFNINLERFPAKTDSINMLQENISVTRSLDRAHIRKEEHRLQPSHPAADVDRSIALLSRPSQRRPIGLPAVC